MVMMVKNGCYVLLENTPNEAENESYYGLHQWNFSILNTGDFLISSRRSQINITKKYRAFAMFPVCKTLQLIGS